MFAIGIVFFFFIGENGTILEKDSFTYLDYSELNLRGAAPVYPLFLHLCRYLLGSELFVDRLYIVQGLLALITSVYFSKYISEQFELGAFYGIAVFICSLLPYSYTLKEYVATHAVLTESFAFPIFYLYFISIFEIQRGITVKRALSAVLVAVTLVLTRKQLVICLVVLIYLIVYGLISEHGKNGAIKQNRIIVLFSLLFWSSFLALVILFSLKSTSQLGNALLGKSLMVIEQNDEMHFDNEGDKEIFKSLYMAIESEGTRLEDTRSDFLKWDDIVRFNEANLRIAYEVIPTSIKAQGQISGVNDRMYDYMGMINRLTLRYHFMDLFEEFLWMIPSGLLSMVFIQKRDIYPLCLLYGVIFYIVFILLFSYLKKNKAGYNKTLYFSLLSILISISNLVFTNMSLYGIQRYMVYSMGILYISMILMIKDYIKQVSKHSIMSTAK